MHSSLALTVQQGEFLHWSCQRYMHLNAYFQFITLPGQLWWESYLWPSLYRERWPQYNTISSTRHEYSIKTMIWPFMNISEAVAFIINIPWRKEACSFFIQVMDMCGGNREDRGIVYSMWYECSMSRRSFNQCVRHT